MRNPAAQTALGPMFIVALDQYERSPLIQDDVAYRMLPTGMKVLARLMRPRLPRQAMIRSLDRSMRGGWASFLCRKRYVEDKLTEAVSAGVRSVVILGAGLDTSAHRLPILADTSVYEVDLPENIARKRASLHKLHGTVPEHVTLVPVDFQTQDLQDTLAQHGYRFDTRTFFVWEAVTQYLTEEGVRRTMEVLAEAHTGSRLVFTYIRKDFLDGMTFYGAEATYKEYVVKRRLWHFGMNPDGVADFLAAYGWRELEQAGPPEFADRYLLPSGRNPGTSEIERSVYAEKI